MHRLSVTCAFVLAGLLRPAWPLSHEDLTFHAPLTGSATPKFARGNAEPQITGKLRFVDDGVRHGLLTGGPDADLAFETAGHLDLDGCTVAMWVKPVGWSKDTTLRFFMRVGEARDAGGSGQGSFIWFYKFFTYPAWLLVQQNYQQREVFLIGPGSGDADGIYTFEWQDGRWDHLAASWHLNEMRVYVNGHYCGTRRTETLRLLRKLGEHFYIGGTNHQKKADLVISDFFLFNRPLTASEIARLAEKGEAALDGKAGLPTLEADCDFFPSSDRLGVWLSVVGRRPDRPGDLRAALTVESRATGQPMRRTPALAKLETTRWGTTMDTRSFEPGNYRVLATLLSGNDVASQASIDFEKPKRPAWLGNRLGIPTKVPRPWTPIRRQGNALTCWGRTCQWEKALLPSQITTQGQLLLARPIGLIARVNGETIRCTEPSVRLTANAMKAEVASKAVLGPLSVSAEAWMEFDGFIWTKLTLTGPRDASVERLSLEIPYRTEIATLWHANLRPGHVSGKVARTHLAINGYPYSWIGNEVGGLQWCTDRPHAWPVARKDHMVEIEPGERETVFRVTFIDGKRSMAEPFEVAFGLHATPVRPYPKGWRDLEPLNCWWCQWSIHREGHTSGPCGYPVPSPDGRWRKSLKLMTERGKGKPPFPYMALSSFWLGAPEYRVFRSEWARTNFAPAPLDTTAGPWAKTGVCHEAQSFVDWRIWRIHKSFKDNPDLAKGVRDMYLDVTSAPACGNVSHGCGVRTQDGTLIKRYGILGMREFQKRLYCLLQKHWPKMMIINHESGKMHMSQLAFCHIMVDGESTFHNPPYTLDKTNYYELLKLEDWRAEYMGINYGTVPVFLPQPARRVHGNKALWRHVMSETGIPASQHVVGMLLVHDIIPWPAYMHPEPFARVRAMKDAFGWDDELSFIGYWTQHDMASVEADQQPVVTSICRRPGKALIVVMNNSDREARVQLKLSPATLGVGEVTELVDAYAGPTVEYENVDVEAHLAGKRGKRQKLTSPGKEIRFPVRNGIATFAVGARDFRALMAER